MKKIILIGIIGILFLSSFAYAENPYIKIYATSLTESDFEINDCSIAKNITSNIWKVNCTGTQEEGRAKMYETLFYGTTGNDPRVNRTTGLTRLSTSVDRDVGKRGYYASLSSTGNQITSVAHTFDNTVDNFNVSSWSMVAVYQTFSGFLSASWYIPSGTLRNYIERVAVGDGGSSVDEIGTDTSADENDNPADVNLTITTNHVDEHTGSVKVIILSKGNMEEDIVGIGTFTSTFTDFYTRDSIPIFTPLILPPPPPPINYTSFFYVNSNLTLTSDYTPVPYYSANLTLGEEVITCSITEDTTYTDEEIDCSGQNYSVSNGATANFINSNLTADVLDVDKSSGAKTINDINSILTTG